jgi:hypothetical protein
VGRLKRTGHRFIANEEDENTLLQLASQVKEQVGRNGFVKVGDDGRNLFIFNAVGKL